MPRRPIARQCMPGIRMAYELGAGLVVVVLDRERQRDCPGLLASRIQLECERLATSCGGMSIQVAMKDRTFENWLVADLEALRVQPARFRVTAAMERAVSPDRADRCDAMTILRRAVVRGSYNKIEDSARICSRIDIMRLAANSRSFRHFLHVFGHAAYNANCRNPDPTVQSRQVPRQVRKSRSVSLDEYRP